MNITPTEQHQWLQSLIGRWHYESQCNMSPDQPPATFTGTEVVKPLGKLWIIAEGEGTMPDGEPALTRLTLGYDPQLACYVGTFVGSMMTFQWVYRGQLSADRKILTLDTEGPICGPTGFGNSMAKYQDITEIINENERVFRSQILDENGTWQQIMSSRYTRID